LRGRLEVLFDDGELAPGVELHDVPREHADVNDVADPTLLAVAVFVEMHPDLLRTDGELPAVPLEHVRDADEAGDELGRRTFVDVGRRTDLLDPALVEDREAVAHRERLLLVVGDVDEGDADLADLALDALELDLHLLPKLEVERAQWLVEEQHPRGIHERARERDPLTLASRELDGLAIAEPWKPHDLQDLVHSTFALRTRDMLHAQAVSDVLGDGHVREERVVLEDRVDVPLVGRAVRNVGSAELDATFIGPLEAGDQPERRRLAGAGRAQQGEELAGGNLEIDPVDRDDVAVRLADAGEPDIDFGRRHDVCGRFRLSQRGRRQAIPPAGRARARATRRRS